MCWLEQATQCCDAKFQNRSDPVHKNVLLCHVESPMGLVAFQIISLPRVDTRIYTASIFYSTVWKTWPSNQGREKESGALTQVKNSEAYMAPDNFC